MRRNTLAVGFFLILLSCVFATGSTLAQPPDRLTPYRFLPRHSLLHVQGGFAGFDIQANIRGRFGFVDGFRFDFPNLDPYAAFLNVKAEAINPTDFGTYSFDLDQTLNLTGLVGEPIPVGAPFDVFKFHGEEGQGAPMALTVVRLGRWLYMHGANRPTCCDFFEYEIEAIARQIPYADFNLDDRVGDDDLDSWRAGNGDADDDADSDGSDFLTWQQQRGEGMPSMESFAELATLASQTAELHSIPEPATLLLLIFATSLTASRRPARKRAPQRF